MTNNNNNEIATVVLF